MKTRIITIKKKNQVVQEGFYNKSITRMMVYEGDRIFRIFDYEKPKGHIDNRILHPVVWVIDKMIHELKGWEGTLIVNQPYRKIITDIQKESYFVRRKGKYYFKHFDMCCKEELDMINNEGWLWEQVYPCMLSSKGGCYDYDFLLYNILKKANECKIKIRIKSDTELKKNKKENKQEYYQINDKDYQELMKQLRTNSQNEKSS